MQLELIADCLKEGLGALAGDRTPEAWSIRTAAYRLLTEGEPVKVEDIAQASGHTVEEVQRCLGGSSDVDDDGRVEATMGLSLRQTQHRIKIGETQLYTWCALDLLFIPPTLGVTAEIESPSPTSEKLVRAVVAPSGIDKLDPADAVVSVVPIRSDSDEIRGAFCNFVHFFASAGDAAPWAERRPDAWVLPAKEAFQLGILFVDRLGGNCCG